jgi:S1-C subfamily serine protease
MRTLSSVVILSSAVLFSLLRTGAADATQTTATHTGSQADFAKLLAEAQQGDAKAQYAVGLAYDAPYRDWGGVVEENVIEAEKWYRKAAEQGYVWAQNMLGCTYLGRRDLHGRVVPQDYYEAVKWLRKAAEQNDSSGQENLARLYLKGEGVSSDKVQAYKWLTLAARSDEDSADKERIESEMAELAGTMNPQQIALAERFARDFAGHKKQSGQAKDRDQGFGALTKASGSGFFISEDGALITNFHVVDGASRIVVKTRRGSFPAAVLTFDSANDIAVIKVSGATFPSLPMTPSRNAKLADSVFTIGFPNPEMQGTEPKFTDGKINSLTGANDDARHFQISVAVQPGNSGGPLVNLAGNVVGVVTARLSDKAALESSGALPQNVNYAVKSSYLLALTESLPQLSGKLKTAWPKKQRNFDDVVKETQEAVALVLVY